MTQAFSIQVRRVYDPPGPDDGARILVDRLWPRGVSRERAHLTLWLRDIAPSTELRKWFAHDPEKWSEFRRRYEAELDDNPAAVAEIMKIAGQGRVTLLYGARDTQHNEAVVLADWLRARN
ncbi:DUF488 family protein [Acetobacter musti]|uniref:DUF488 family protein n=1 Tax=Acetobacter musti TaxID=864732 RepID=A0ABX0JSC3_9PROT|nr:DUF488 domain-containing protein [Acetobacter musti]NHN85693.1 DUF488 family protein [Acetobacter musti]